MMPLVTTIVWWGYLACFVYLLLVAVAFLLLAFSASFENKLRAREARNEDFDTLRDSPFTIPVSVIAPAYNEEVCITAAVQSMLALNYPEFEVIVINDGSTDGTLDRLIADFDLKPVGTFYRRVIASTPVRQLYRSEKDPRLLVVDKPNGGKADSLNCGVNLARYRYICGVDGDTIYFPDALLNGMRLAIQNPAEVIGVTSQVGISSQPEHAQYPDGEMRVDHSPFIAYQVLDYLRAFVTCRLAWNRGNYMLCAIGAFMLWRKDVVIELGGFSSEFTCEDIEFTFRVHEHYRTRKQPYQIISLPDIIGVTEGPNTPAKLISQRARWQRVISETVWYYRRMIGNVRYGSVGFFGMPYYVLGEILAPIFQVLAVAVIVVGAVTGLLDLRQFVQSLVALAFGTATLSNAAIFLQERHSPIFKGRDLRFLVLLAPMDLVLYRPIIFWAQFRGMIEFLRGDRSWNKFARNVRTAG